MRVLNIKNVLMFYAFLLERLDLFFKLRHVLERPIDGSKADIGDLIKFGQVFHHDLANLAALQLALLLFLDIAFDQMNQAIKLFLRVRPLGQGLQDPVDQLAARVGFAVSVPFYNHNIQQFHLFERREPILALVALPAAANHHAVLRQTRIHDTGFFRTTGRTTHIDT